MSTLFYKFFSKKFKLLRSGQIGLSFSLPMCCCFKLSSYYIEKLHAWHRRMQAWSLDSVFLFLFHLAQREPDGICRVGHHHEQCRNCIECTMRDGRHPDAAGLFIEKIQQTVHGKAEHAPYHKAEYRCAQIVRAVLITHQQHQRPMPDAPDDTAQQTASAALEAAFDFMEQAFAESQEMVVFVTELTLSPAAHAFIAENGCERYFQYNKDLLLDHRKAALQQELAAEERRHGGM